MISSAQIRSDFLEFFRERGHEVVASSPVAPKDDPTLLFANAGMNQFKDVFLGTGSRPYTRAASTQKCLRVSGKHNDLEEVGRDTYHHTLFEMLGNWSFGDYGKREAITWAWELLTKVWGLPKDKLYATVFEGTDDVPFDQEAWDIWEQETDIPKDHILKGSRKDNFWEMGDTGPCGPCTEIHIDRGERFGKLDPKTCFVNTDHARFIELWNLVFIAYHRDEEGVLHELPAKHVDTGAGFERLAAVLQDRDSNYDTDVFQPLIQRVAELSGVKYSEETGTPHRVIADHIRALSFAIADGALPSNEGRGYVLRRILRRAARFGRELGFTEPFLSELAATLAECMGESFPELPAQLSLVQEVLRSEEESFGRTLDRGLDLFADLERRLRRAGASEIPGEEAFRLYDTFGFPLDLTQQMAAERGLTVDAAGFDAEMLKQREQSRDARRKTVIQQAGPWQDVHTGTGTFVGYDLLETSTEILRWREAGEDRIELVLSQTPFYAESGGQVGDRGVIRGDAWQLVVDACYKEDDQVIHGGSVRGSFEPTALVSAEVAADLRHATERNHTATHLLQAALRQVLGDHVQQEGSLVEPGRLRFDFRHTRRMELDEIERVERIVHEMMMADKPLRVSQSTYDDAVARGVTALFGEKYGDRVRVVEVPGYSAELCGGTHLVSTGQLGGFAITTESSVAAGIRRVEAVTGKAARQLVQEQRRSLERIRDTLGSHGSDEVEKLRKLLEEKKELQRELNRLREELAMAQAAEAMGEALEVNGVAIQTVRSDGADMNQLKGMCDKLREGGQELVALCAAVTDDKPMLAVVVSDGVIAKHGIKAGDLVRELAPLVGGGGGGRPQLATAGGKNAAGMDEVLKHFVSRVTDLLQKG